VDHASARGCFRIAASSGNSFARYSLGMMLLNGLGGPADESEAIGLFAAAARKGHIPSMRQLAKWHLEEDRSENQRRAGIAWLRKLAHLDDLASILDLINRHQRGLDVEQSASEARKWQEKAAALGDTQSQFELAQAHVNGDFEGADVTTAIYLFKSSAEAGHPLAQWHLERILGPAPKPPERKPGFDFGFGKKTAA
jgi:TPR repeat protein